LIVESIRISPTKELAVSVTIITTLIGADDAERCSSEQLDVLTEALVRAIEEHPPTRVRLEDVVAKALLGFFVSTHAPDAVKLLDDKKHVILTVTHSEKSSMNGKGSENTRSVIIEGPTGSVVTCYDDQLFRVDENSVVLVKTTSEDIEVPIATDFVSGDLPEGIYRGTADGYVWQLNKAVEVVGESFWEEVVGATERLIEWVIEHWSGGEDPELESEPEELQDLSRGLADNPNMHPVPDLPPGVVGYALNGSGSHSTNNHVDNLSSIRLGNAPE
jgi:hypothetical protein